MSIVSPERLRAYLGKSAEAVPNETLLPFAEAATDAIERYCHRKFKKKTHVECVPIRDGKTLFLSLRPILSIKGIWRDKPLTLARALTQPEYDVNKEAGIVWLRNRIFDSKIYIRYQGGFSPIPAAITQAVLMLAGFYWQRSQHNSDGLQSESLGAYSVQYDCDAWPAHVLSLLRDFKSADLF